jgi:hypothetical protein
MHALAAVQRFVAVRGTSRIPSRAMADGVEIGAWVLQQRERYWGARLTPRQVADLERVPGWTWSGVAEQKWQRALSALTGYTQRNGTAAVPITTVVGQIRLGEWVAAQRAGYEAGTLPPANASALESLPGWQWHHDQDWWQKGLAMACTYVALHGTIDAPPGARVGDFHLEPWVQRCRAEHRAGDLSPQQTSLLESLPGWRWSRSMERWDIGLAALRDYIATHGTASPPQHAMQNGFPVGEWVHARRRQHLQRSLTADRVAALEALPGWQWNVFTSRWEAGYGHLKRFADVFGHASPAAGVVVEGYPLGRWVRDQRRAHSAGRLSTERVTALQSLPGWRWRAR